MRSIKTAKTLETATCWVAKDVDGECPTFEFEDFVALENFGQHFKETLEWIVLEFAGFTVGCGLPLEHKFESNTILGLGSVLVVNCVEECA